MRVLIATAEVSPIAKTGGLGDVCGALPKTLRALGHEVVVFMPFYRQAREWFARNGVSVEPIAETRVLWADWSANATYFRTNLPGSDVPLILVANDYFFNREQIYDRRLDGFDDYIERYTFFCRAIVAGVDLIGFSPDILHAHDWHTALLPVYLDSGLRGSERFRGTRSVFTIHNLNYQGNADPSSFALTGLHSRYWAPDALEHFGQVNPMKGGIIFADQVTTVSPNYAREIQTSAHGAGLDGILRSLSFKLNGILNGIDTAEWDPMTDAHIPSKYGRDSITGKQQNKRALLQEAHLKYHSDTPVITIVSRLVEQKGFQLLLPVLPSLLRAGAQAVILGSGESDLELAFKRVEAMYPESCRVWIGFDNARAHRMYAGADLLAMPSIYEPCGLNQMYALRYGTLPVVRMTGGLADTVVPYDGNNLDRANGFGFTGMTAADVQTAMWVALLNFRDGTTWRLLQENGMAADFSWDRSARDYEFIYRRALS